MKPSIAPVTFVGALLTCSLAVLAPACKKGEDSGASAAPAASAPAAAAPAAEAPAAPSAALSADRAEGAKLAAAIECLNRNSGRVFEVRDNYMHSVDPATGSSHGKKPALLGLYGTEPCLREVKAAGALTPAVPELDHASAAYAAALDALSQTYEQLTGYYEKGDYIDDKGKKATLLHPKVVEAFKTFGAAHRELSTTVRALNRKRRQAKLAAREQAEGRNLEVIIDTMMLEAETLVAMVKPDAEPSALAAQIATYAKLVDEVDARAVAHPDEASKRGSITNVRNYDKSFLAASKNVSRKLAAKDHPSSSDLADVNQQYNSLVDNYNNH
jgi:Protein of unknown function (DUF3829)